MKGKFKLPILLLAIVIMLSIFYIIEGDKKNNQTEVGGEDFTTSKLNPDFTEARLKSYNETQAEILRLEGLIAEGGLSSEEVSETMQEIDTLKEIKSLEINVENYVIEEFKFDDVLAVYALNDKVETLTVNLYTDESITPSLFVNLTKSIIEEFDIDYQILIPIK